MTRANSPMDFLDLTEPDGAADKKPRLRGKSAEEMAEDDSDDKKNGSLKKDIGICAQASCEALRFARMAKR